MNKGYKTLTQGYADMDTFTNNFISFDYKITKETETEVKFFLELKRKWSEQL